MKTALVSGASGVLGSRLVKGLRAGGWAVRALVKPGDPFRDRLAGTGVQLVEADLESPGDSFAQTFSGVDVVYHLAAVILSPEPSVFERINRRGTAHMVEAAAGAGVRHFVYVSSASVTYPRRTPYAESKLAGETLVKQAAAAGHFRYTIVRPTLIYDHQGGQEFLLYWRYLTRFPIVPFIGDGRSRKRPVFAGDIVQGLTAIAGNDRSYDQTYNFSGSDSVTMAELGRLMLEARGQSRPFLHLPVWLFQAAALLAGLFMKDPPLTLQGIAGFVNDADLSPDSAIRDLGYRPVGVRQGLKLHFAAEKAPLSPQPVKELVT